MSFISELFTPAEVKKNDDHLYRDPIEKLPKYEKLKVTKTPTVAQAIAMPFYPIPMDE